MTSNKVIILAVAFLGFIAIAEAMSLRSLGVELRCRCILTESKPIGRHIQKVVMIAPNSHCRDTEIIATMNETGQEVCLDPEAPWVKKIIIKIIEREQKRRAKKPLQRET